MAAAAAAGGGDFVRRTYMPGLCPETHVICKSYSLKTHKRGETRHATVSVSRLHNSAAISLTVCGGVAEAAFS